MRRFKPTRDFFMPRNVPISWMRLKDCPLEIGRYSQAGALYSLGFYGKQQKPAWHFRHRDTERREKHIAEMIKNFQHTAEYKAKRRAERKAFVHSLKVGDVLNTCWGYDQTNREFYEVTAVKGAFVTVRELAQRSTETGFMCGQCAPKCGEYIGPEMHKRVTEGNGIKLGHHYAHVYAMHEIALGVKVGKPVYWSSYA